MVTILGRDLIWCAVQCKPTLIKLTSVTADSLPAKDSVNTRPASRAHFNSNTVYGHETHRRELVDGIQCELEQTVPVLTSNSVSVLGIITSYFLFRSLLPRLLHTPCTYSRVSLHNGICPEKCVRLFHHCVNIRLNSHEPRWCSLHPSPHSIAYILLLGPLSYIESVPDWKVGMWHTAVVVSHCKTELN